MEDKLYVLQLEDGKYYVGKTADVKKRFEQHASGKGAEWTKIHKPLKLVETRRITSEHDENNLTKDLMKKYGTENVRGGSYCQIVLPDSTKKTIQTEIRGTSNACFKCGSHGHFARDCPEDDDGGDTDEDDSDDDDDDDDDDNDDDSDDDDDNCYRCGRSGHWKDDCHAYVNVSGKYLGQPKRNYRTDWSDDDSD